MLKYDVTYNDFEGKERTESFYFNLMEPEIVELEAEYASSGGLENFLKNIDPQNRPKEVVDLFKTMLLNAYGEKSADGRFFLKKKEVVENFSQSAAYGALFMELLQDQDKAAAFFTGLITQTVPSSNKTE
jgi:hypothetical protein